MSIIHEKTPNKYFYLQEQQKQTEKHIKPIQNEKKMKFSKQTQKF